MAIIAVAIYLVAKKPKRNVPAPAQNAKTDTVYDISSYNTPSSNTPSYNYPPKPEFNPPSDEEGSEADQYRAYADIYNITGLTDAEKELLMKSTGTSYIEELKKLAELRQNGILTEEEFQREKKEILYRANKVETVPCTYCGSAIEAYMDKCPSCGAPMKADKKE